MSLKYKKSDNLDFLDISKCLQIQNFGFIGNIIFFANFMKLSKFCIFWKYQLVKICDAILQLSSSRVIG